MASVEQGLTPLDFLLSVMREPANDLDYRLEAAKAAAPYCHPRLAQTAVTLNAGLNVAGLSDKQVDNEIRKLLKDPEVAAALGLTAGTA